MTKYKLALHISYNGSGYSGLQYNEPYDTIERALIEILAEEKLIRVENKDPKKIGLQRCCRTDKGVSATLNIVVVKVQALPNLESLNEKLKPLSIFIYKYVRVSKTFFAKSQVCSRVYKYYVPCEFIKDLPNFKKNIAQYLGSKNYANFTAKNNERGKIRHISAIEYRNMGEYMEIVICGQSFMLHQIRKMVGLLLLIDRYSFDSEKTFEKAFSSDSYINIPKAPGEFLLLRRPVFDGYNKRRENTHDPIFVEEDRLDEREEFLCKSMLDRSKDICFDHWFNTIDEHYHEFEHFQ